MPHTISEDTLRLLFEASNSSHLESSLEIMIQKSRYDTRHSYLASQRVLPAVLEILKTVNDISHHHLLSLSLKLLRNLCAAGEYVNQNSFLELNGVGIVLNILTLAVAGYSDSHFGLVRLGLEVLANVSLAHLPGKQHKHSIWDELCTWFVSYATLSRKVRVQLPLMIYAWSDGNREFFSKLLNDGWPIVAEILSMASSAGFDKDWFKLLLSRICLEEPHLRRLFSALWSADVPAGESIKFRYQFSSKQASLLQTLSEFLNEPIGVLTVKKDAARVVLEIFKQSVGVLEHAMRGKSGIPTGIAAVDVLWYSLSILRNICSQHGVRGNREDAEDVVDVLLSYGLIELLLSLLRDLEPLARIRKAIKRSENQDATNCSSKPCPYKGFRRDIVSLIGNCIYRRKHAQDEVRQRNGILLLLQHCVTDEDNPFVREWGIWCVRNLLEGNEENQRAVSELELQGSFHVPEIAAPGLDHKTGCAKLVNVA